MRRLERHVFPTRSYLPISAITAPLLLEVLRRTESKGAAKPHTGCGRGVPRCATMLSAPHRVELRITNRSYHLLLDPFLTTGAASGYALAASCSVKVGPRPDAQACGSIDQLTH